MKKINDKNKINKLNHQDNHESFLTRWSSKKSKSKDSEEFNEISDLKESEILNDKIEEEDKLTEEELKLSDDELADKYEVSNPEKLDNSIDLREVLNKNIPDRLKQLALKRLWRIVPLYGEVSELVEYGEDFTDAATVIDNLQSAYVVGKGYLDKVIEKSDKIIENSDKVIEKIDENKIPENQKEPELKDNKINSNDQKDENTETKNKNDLITEKKAQDSELNLQNEEDNKDIKPLRPSKMVFKKNTN